MSAFDDAPVSDFIWDHFWISHSDIVHLGTIEGELCPSTYPQILAAAFKHGEGKMQLGRGGCRMLRENSSGKRVAGGLFEELEEEKGLRLGRLEPRDGTVEVTTDGHTT
jgi:hypothetical protein